MAEALRHPTLHTAGLAAAEAAANAALRLSPHSRLALAKLADQVIAVECTRPAMTLYLRVDSDGEVELRGVHDGPVTTRVRGAARDFAELAAADDPAATLINGGLQLQGSSSLLIDLQRVFSELDIDWEAPLVQGLGDVAGHQLAEMLRGSLSWSRQSAASLRRQLAEFAVEEARLAPPRLELEDFYRDVSALEQRSERLERQLQRLRGRLQQLARS
jgi:ubiquinone biosynthesis protein UbiJ